MTVSYTYTSGQILTAAELNASFQAIYTTQPNGDNSTNAATTAFCYNNFLPQTGGTLSGSVVLPNTNGIYQIGQVANGFYADTSNLALRVANASSSVFLQWVNPNTAAVQQIAVFGTASALMNVPFTFTSNVTTYGTFTAPVVNATTVAATTVSANSINVGTANLTSLITLAGGAQIGQFIGAGFGYYADMKNLSMRVPNATSTIFFQGGTYVTNIMTANTVMMGVYVPFSVTSDTTMTGNLSVSNTVTATTVNAVTHIGSTGSYSGTVVANAISASSYSGGTLTGIVYAPANANLAYQLATSNSAFYVQTYNGVNNLLSVGTAAISVGVPMSAPTMYTTTMPAGNSSTYVATTAFVQNAITLASGIPAGNTNVLLGGTGTYGAAAVVVPSNGLAITSGTLCFGAVTGAQWQKQGPYISWNQAGTATGETDFYNSKGQGVGGFYFYNVSSNATATPALIASFFGSGFFQCNAVQLPTTTFTPTTGSTITIPTYSVSAFIQPAGTISTLTVVLPALPAATNLGNATNLDIFFINGVSTVTWSGTTVGASMPSSASAGTAVKLMYNPAIGAWAHYTLS